MVYGSYVTFTVGWAVSLEIKQDMAKNSKTFEQLDELEINLEASQKLIKQLLP